MRNLQHVIRVTSLVALLVAAGCTTDEDLGDASPIVDPLIPHECDGTAAVLGSGLDEFLFVEDGDTVSLYRGPQGGYMLLLSLRAKGLEPSDIMFCYTETFAATGETLGAGCSTVRLSTEVSGGWRERVGLWGQVDPRFWETPGAIRGQDVSVSVIATDPRGCQVTDGWSVWVAKAAGQ